MSKSETVKNKFVDYVVRDMMNDITIEEEFIRFGMSYNENPEGIFYDYEEWFDSGDRFDYMNYEESFISDLSILIRIHLSNAYGIPWGDSKTDVSVSPILLKLYNIILKKVHHLWGRNKRLNESKKHAADSIYMKIDNPKQHKFFNRIADKVVDLVEVREKEGWGKSIFLTDLLDPRFPGQGTSLPRREEGYSDYQTFVSKMTPTMSDFFPMLENYWSIDDVSVNIFIIVKFIYPKLWNNFYKGEDHPEESTDYGERALDYEENKEEVNESTSKQQKLIDVVTKDLLKNTRLSKSYSFNISHNKGVRTVKLPNGLSDWNSYDLQTTDDAPYTIGQYMVDTYGLTTDEIKGVWLKYRNNLINTLEDNDPNPSIVMGESESKNNLEKLIDKLYKEIWGYLITNKNEVHLDLPYFKDLKSDAQIPYDPYRQDIGNFNSNFIRGELERFVAYHLYKTMDIGEKLQFRNYDPMVKPIAEKLIKSLYKEVVDKGFVKSNQVEEKKYNLSETIMDDIPLEQFKKDNPEVVEILNRFPEPLQRELAVERKNPKEFVEEHGNWYVRDKDQPLKTMEIKNILDDEETKGIVSRTPQEVVDAINTQWGTNFVGGEVYDPNPDRYFKYADLPAETADPSVMVNYDIIYGVGRLVAALIRGDKTIKVWDIVDKKENLNESVDWSDKKGNKYHRNGMVNRIVDDFLKMTEIMDESIKFHMKQHIINNLRRHRDPYLIYVYDENGLSKESKDLLYEGLTNGVQWYMEQTGLINYHHPHANTRPPEDVELLKMVVDTLYPIIVKGIVDYNEDEEWTMDTLNDSKFLGESTDKQVQYVNYVIKHLMDNTKWWDASFSALLLNNDTPITTYINYGDFVLVKPTQVVDLLKGFGVTEQEEKRIWATYSRWVLEKVMREGNIDWPNKETHKKRYPFLVESTDITTKFVEKIPDIIRESSVPKYLDKIFNSVVKEIRFDVDKYGAVVIPFISKERYSSSTGGLETQEYTLSKHDRNTELRDGGMLHSEFKSYFHEIYGLSEVESNELFRLVKQYIKDELYYKSVLDQILQSVQDDYIQGYGTTIEVTPEISFDLKIYSDFKEYVYWWHSIVDPDDYGDGSADITDDMTKKLYDDVWDTLKNTITLNEGWPADPELDDEGNEKWDRMFPDKFYLKTFKMIDKDPEFFMKEILRNLGFEYEEEYDILYNYFVNYSDRKDYYIDFTIDPQDIAHFFSDRDYDMEKIVKGLLEGDWDYHEWYNESFQFDDYFLDYIDDDSWGEIAKILVVDNITDAKELVSGNVKNEKLKGHHELMEMRIDDVQSIIAQSTTEAQADADISYLHDDIMDEVNDWFKHGVFNFGKGEFEGKVEIGDVMTKTNGLPYLEAEIEHGYPSFWDIVHVTLREELDEWGYQEEYIFTGDEKPYINTDKHFRYGGAGTINNEHFNDMLAERLSWEYSE